LVVDEFADLIMTAGKEVEMPIRTSCTVGKGYRNSFDHCYAKAIGKYYYGYHQS
jgi:hypothetical protein